MALGLSLTALSSAQLPKVFVDPAATGTGFGNDWANAATTVTSGIQLAAFGGDILVAHGTYLPTTESIPMDPRSKTFLLGEAKSLIGGYLGVAGGPNASTDPDAPDGSAQQTILSGDIGVPGLLRDNAYSVVTIVGTPNVSNFETIRHLTICDGLADVNSTSAETSSGAGVFCCGPSVLMDGVIIRDNVAIEEGGGFYFSGLNGPSSGFGIKLCKFVNNTAGLRGGGAFVEGHDSYDLPGQVLDSAFVFNTEFRANRAGQASQNLSTSGGGAVYFGTYSSSSGLPLNRMGVANNRVLNNTAWGHGSAYFVQGEAAPVAGTLICNDTLTGNHMAATAIGAAGEAVYIASATNVTSMTNCIVWGNTGPLNPSTLDGPGALGPNFQATYSDIERLSLNGSPNPFPGTGNISADPMFVNAATFNIRVMAGSPCIDAGSVATLIGDYADLNNNQVYTAEKVPFDWSVAQLRARVINGVPDMGAHEK